MRMGLALIGAGAVLAAPAPSAVTSSNDMGFAVENSVTIAADAASVYRLIGQPRLWWDGAHSYSGDAANFSLKLEAGGCFCETLPGRAGAAGSVEHGRVIQAAPGRLVRISGALGPLQAEAVTGTFSFAIAPAGKGVKLVMTYVAGGYMRMPAGTIAPAVDEVLAGQLARLKRAAEAEAG